MRSPRAGWMRPPIALIVAVVGALVALPAAALPAAALAAEPASTAPVATVSPADGELVGTDPLLRWTASGDSGYELRWNADGALDASGALDPSVGGGRVFPGGPSHQLTGLTAVTYHWQVRAMPEGEWSAIATFHLDIQLDTLGPGSGSGPDAADAPLVEQPAEEQPPRAGAGVDLGATLTGFAWIAGASSFAGLLLAVVGREWLRLRRQEQL